MTRVVKHRPVVEKLEGKKIHVMLGPLPPLFRAASVEAEVAVALQVPL